MATHRHRTLNPDYYPEGPTQEMSASAVSWSAIWAGAIVASAVSLVLLSLGSGFGLASVSSWPGMGARAETFSVMAGIWLVVTQWISSLFGGYVAGRTRTRWSYLHTDEVFFRDTVHGLLTWSLATVVVIGVAVLATSLTASTVSPNDVPTTPEAMEAARRAASRLAFTTGVSLIVGAFIASVAAAYGGHLRDDHP